MEISFLFEIKMLCGTPTVGCFSVQPFCEGLDLY